MAITQCAAGHYYDNDLYASCPYCNNNQSALDFSSPDSHTVPLNITPMGGQTMPLDRQPDKTVPMSQYMGGSVLDGNPTQPPAGYMDGSNVTDNNPTKPPKNYVYPRTNSVTDDQPTVIPGFHDGYDPVVGWLVCMEGPGRGKDYRIYSHVNTIGRSPNNRICLPEDKEVSREIHAKVAYDPVGNIFRLIPGDYNTVYLNRSPVYAMEILKPYDVIRLGKTELLFMPLCGRCFSWDSGLNQAADGGRHEEP